ncbi:cytochrome-c peroxidase [Photobacterium sanguinicancri]|uniref:cytochrome-c peroxidase n=1 Tax=Photobacterium sanguinicancri TaxID=875932 RepID=UPI0024816DC5|nr:cytochrome c peroxidase [Photobacterium sanguinicancri]
MNTPKLIAMAVVLTSVVACDDDAVEESTNPVVSVTTEDTNVPPEQSPENPPAGDESDGDGGVTPPPAGGGEEPPPPTDGEGGGSGGGSGGGDDPAPEPEPEPKVDIDGLSLPDLSQSGDFETYVDGQPQYYTRISASFGNVSGQDNTPFDNRIKNAGANLGRVLFYDKRLSFNNTVACASCHQQEHGFSDPMVFSDGFDGGKTGRHSMSLSNAAYYSPRSFFWDERADTLEDQVLMPIQDGVEMGMNLLDLEVKLGLTSFYGPMFNEAFGDEAITSHRIAKALAQFIRAMVSYQSKYDRAFTVGTWNDPKFEEVFTEQEMLGLRLFSGVPGDRNGSLGCDTCHHTSAHTADQAHNNGLDGNNAPDQGAGNGFFKVPSLRNIAASPPYMHDGRLATLMDVVEFYNSGVQAHRNLAPALRRNGSQSGPPVRFNLSQEEKEALVAFMETLTDDTLLTLPIFSDPFEE